MFTPILSTLATFDDIRRCSNVLTDGSAEIEFLRVLEMQEAFRRECLTSVQEAQRLQKELDSSLKSLADLETKLFHARRLLEAESKSRAKAEHERDEMEKKIIAVADLLQHERNLKDETRNKLASLSTLPRKRKSHHPQVEAKYGNEINSTASFLSDLSITQSEDDFLDVQNSRTWHKHRPSLPKNTVPCVGAKRSRRSIETPPTVKAATTRRSITRQSVNQQQQHQLEVNPNAERICATTKVTIPQDGNGAIRAESTIETLPVVNGAGEAKVVGESPDEQFWTPGRTPFNGATAPPMTPAGKTPARSATINSNTPAHMRPTMFRQHNFISKTSLRSETCAHCQKKIRFGAIGYRCRECPVRCHQDCSNLITISCVPQTGTPTTKGLMGYISDFAPAISPRVPALIVHCVNEIEKRGLAEVGLYRQSGSERQVKQLKELFLRGKTTPHLANIDVHVLCCCIKDFLRSLREPLIPTALWKDFCNAVQSHNDEDIQKGLHKAINALSQPNRDTLAFLMLHFQRVAETRESLMPIENIARVFGPTLVAHSTPEPDQHAFLAEIHVQCSIIAHLLSLPAEYWSQFIVFDVDKENFKDGNGKSTLMTPSQRQKDDAVYSLYATPSKTTVKKRKFLGTPPCSQMKN